jgi:hypothetical protein
MSNFKKMVTEIICAVEAHCLAGKAPSTGRDSQSPRQAQHLFSSLAWRQLAYSQNERGNTTHPTTTGYKREEQNSCSHELTNLFVLKGVYARADKQPPDQPANHAFQDCGGPWHKKYPYH